MRKRSVSFLIALLSVAMLLCMMPFAAGAEDGEMTDSKTVILEYTGEPIDVSALFDEQPDGAVYTLADDGSDSDVGSEGQLVGTMLTLTNPGSFRVIQTVGDTEVWISLGVYYTLTVTVKDQSVLGLTLFSTTLDDIERVEGLREGHSVTAVTLSVSSATEVGAHDEIKAQAVTVMNGDQDVSSYYNIKSNNGNLHIFSAEWASTDGQHFLACAALGCELRSGEAEHDFDNRCDSCCDVCGVTRQVPDHEWTKEGIVIKAATETEAGERLYLCLYCDAARSEIIPVVEYTPVFLIVCVVISCVVVLGCLVCFAVYSAKKKAAATAAPAEEEIEEKAEEKVEE